MRYWSKITIFSYTLAFDAPVRGGVGIFSYRLVQTNENAVEPTRRRKIFKDVCILFDRIPACDGQTDRHLATAESALCIASRGKNCMRNAVTCIYAYASTGKRKSVGYTGKQ